MGFKSFMKKIIYGHDDEDAELQAARAKHGIIVGETGGEEEDKDKDKERYDAWEDIRNFRTNFIFGSWATRKFRVIGEEKVKKELAELEKKREEEAKRKQEIEGEG